MAAPAEEPDEDELWTDEVIKREEERKANPYKEHEGKTLEQLKEAEDEIPEDAMAALRKKRLQQLKEQAARNKFGTVIEIGEPQWKSEVTEAEKDVYVVIHLYASLPECNLVDNVFRELASKFKAVRPSIIRPISPIPPLLTIYFFNVNYLTCRYSRPHRILDSIPFPTFSSVFSVMFYVPLFIYAYIHASFAHVCLLSTWYLG